MSAFYASLLCALPAAALILAVLAKKRDEWRNLWVVMVVLFPLVVVPTAAIHFVFARQQVYGVLYGVVSYMPVIVLFIALWFNTNLSLIQFLPFGVCSLLAFVVAIPLCITPALRGAKAGLAEPQKRPVELSTGFLSGSVSNIRTALGTLLKGIEGERAKLDVAIKSLTENLEKRNQELASLQSELKTLRTEVEQYRQLASMSGAQAEAVAAMIQKGKYWDYVIGFLVGIGSSATVVAFTKLPSFLTRLKRK